MRIEPQISRSLVYTPQRGGLYYDVTYIPDAPGDYVIHVSFGGRPADGSPFSVHIDPNSEIPEFSVLEVFDEGEEESDEQRFEEQPPPADDTYEQTYAGDENETLNTRESGVQSQTAAPLVEQQPQQQQSAGERLAQTNPPEAHTLVLESLNNPREQVMFDETEPARAESRPSIYEREGDHEYAFGPSRELEEEETTAPPAQTFPGAEALLKSMPLVGRPQDSDSETDSYGSDEDEDEVRPPGREEVLSKRVPRDTLRPLSSTADEQRAEQAFERAPLPPRVIAPASDGDHSNSSKPTQELAARDELIATGQPILQDLEEPPSYDASLLTPTGTARIRILNYVLYKHLLYISMKFLSIVFVTKFR